MLVLDHLHHRLHNNLPDETPLHNGQKFDLLGLGLLGVPQLADHFNEIQNKLQELKFDVGDYICMKFLLLLNPGTFELSVIFFFVRLVRMNSNLKSLIDESINLALILNAFNDKKKSLTNLRIQNSNIID